MTFLESETKIWNHREKRKLTSGFFSVENICRLLISKPNQKFVELWCILVLQFSFAVNDRTFLREKLVDAPTPYLEQYPLIAV